MTKERKARILTGLVIAATLAGIAYKKGSFTLPTASITQPKSDPAPQDAIYAMLDAARDGKVNDYLGAHTGQMLVALRKAVAESTEAAFAQYLKDSNAPVKGVALQEPQTLTDREVKVKVEYVFQDRNEIQFLYLEKQGSAWKIARVDAAERIKTLVPYGTPVQ